MQNQPRVSITRRFTFAAGHILGHPEWDDARNREVFGACSMDHGHNYELQVTLRAEPDASGTVMPIPLFERTVAEAVIERFDHKNLNVELPEFEEVIPSVENIAAVIYRLLKPRFTARLRYARISARKARMALSGSSIFRVRASAPRLMA